MTPKQRRALPLIACGKTAKEISEELNIDPSTISRWKNQDKAFMEELRPLQQLAGINSVNQLQAVSPQAVDEVQRIMTTSDNEALRLKAATFIIEKSMGIYK